MSASPWLREEPPVDYRAIPFTELLDAWKSHRNDPIGMMAAEEVCRRLTDKKADSADAGLRQLQRESEDLGLYEPQSAHQHWPGQAQCEWCKGTGAIDAPTSADDPSCPNCDGEGRWEK